jgi:hypothetical protein
MFILTLCSLIILNSCENEKIDLNNVSQTNLGKVSIKDGRLLFQNKESLNKIYKEYADASDDKLSAFLEPLYLKDFFSLRPVVTEKNEEFIYNHYLKNTISKNYLKTESQKRISKTVEENFDYLDDVEEVIGDDTYAALLNSDGEIQVSEDIYKYTDLGLFIVKSGKYNQLQNYLETNSISGNLAIETSQIVKQTINEKFPQEGLIVINNDISYFRTTSKKSEKISVKGKKSGFKYINSNSKLTATDPDYNVFLNNLASCNPHSGLFGNLFGDNDVCIDQYESRRRVKTKAFNYNYLLVYHLGVKCVHQYRGWTGLWRVEATDEIRLIVEAAQFEYDLDALSGNNAINNLTRERAYFMNNQKAFFTGPNTINFNNEWGKPILTYVNQTSLPQIFQDDLTFDFFGTGNSWLDGQIQNGIDSNLKASQLNEWFYNGLYSQVKSQLQNAFGSSTIPPKNRTFVAKFPQNGKMIIQKSVNLQSFNNGVSERTFDWGAQICFGGGGSSWKIRPDAGCDILVKPKNFKVKIIGAIRKGNNWHGSKFNVGID